MSLNIKKRSSLLKIWLAMTVVWIVTFVIFSLTPQSFIKLVSLEADDPIERRIELSLTNVVVPKDLISSIPYKKGRFVDVLPERRYQRSIIEGNGDCSNLALGLSFSMIENDIDFSIVHLLKMPGFIEGEGHVTLEAAMSVDGKKHSAILDVLEGGVLSDGQKLISAQDLLSKNHGVAKVVSYHPTRDNRSAYYIADNLNDTLLGFTPKSEIQKYFNFIQLIYVDLNERSIERYLYDGLALMLGVFPRIFISNEHIQEVDSQYGGKRLSSIFLLYLARIISVLVLLNIVFVATNMALHRRGHNVD